MEIASGTVPHLLDRGGGGGWDIGANRLVVFTFFVIVSVEVSCEWDLLNVSLLFKSDDL